MRRLLTGVLIGVSLCAVAIVGVVTVLEVRSLLTSRVEQRLATHFDGLSRTLDRGVARLEDQVALVARSGAASEALSSFSAAVDALEADPPTVPATAAERLEAFYGDLRSQAAAVDGQVPPLEDLVPSDPVTRYLQDAYVTGTADGDAQDPPDGAQDATQAQADDGPAQEYADVHAEFDRRIRLLRDDLRFGDVLLLDADGRVVYSADKRADFGIDTTTPPWRDSVLAEAVNRRLPETTVGETVLMDFSPYLPAGGAPVLFSVAAVSDGAEVIGAVAVEVPIAVLNTITTADRRWQDVGLGETGETYLVGRDRLMRSDARIWLEDPARFLTQSASQAQATSIEAAGTTVLQQSVETDAVAAALDGDRFIGQSRNYLGEPRLAVAGPVNAAGLGWVLVADQAVEEAEGPLRAFTRRLLVVGLVLVPLVSLAAFVLARAVTRRVRPVVRTAGALADGDLDARTPTPRNDELQDVGRQLALLAADLRTQQAERAREDRAAVEMLASVLPARLVGALDEAGSASDPLMDTATAVALTVHGPLEVADLDQHTAVELSARLSGAIEDLAAEHGLERVRSSSDEHLYVAGLGEPEAAQEVAAAFVSDVPSVLEDFERTTGVRADYEAGMRAGDVAAVLLDEGEVTYGVFGAPISTAMMLAAVAERGQVLLHPSVATQLGSGWRAVPAEDLVDLRGDPIEAFLLTGRGSDETAAEDAAMPAAPSG